MRTEQRGVITVANDAVLDWFIALVSSLRSTNPGLPVTVLPFDGQVARIRDICARMEVNFWEPTALLEQCDAIGHRVFPRRYHGTIFGRTGNFHRLCAFDGPYDNFLYLDADTVVLSGLDKTFEACQKDQADIVFVDRSDGWSFLPSPRKAQLLAEGAQEWCSGAFLSRRGVASVRDFSRASRERLQQDLPVLRVKVGEQPFISWYVATAPVSAAHLPDVMNAAPAWAFQPTLARAGGLVAADKTKPYDSYELKILHWAGLPQPNILMPHLDRWLAARELYMDDLPVRWSSRWLPIVIPPDEPYEL
ncbi:MAG TPA: hypothetical protein VMR14_03795 [Streptosporangiaceae bacterium]|jgi:hypothetical protein|nr:hypothetical protein [Streptosporangiaceae bacterium]